MVALIFPLVLFAINLISNGGQYQLGILTITQLKESRHTTTMLLSGGNVFFFVWDAFRLILLGDDKLVWNSFRYIGQFYNILAIPFFILAYVKLIKNKSFNIFDVIFTIWLISSLPIVLTVGANTNHWNILWFPVIYFVARGLTFCIEKIRWIKITAISLIVLLTVIFIVKYVYFFNGKNPEPTGFYKEIDYQIKFVGQKNFDEVYYSSEIIHVVSLFYDPVSPYDFARTKEVLDISMPIEHMKRYCNNNFYLPNEILPIPRTAYIIPNHDLDNYVIEYDKFNVDRGLQYTLLWTN